MTVVVLDTNLLCRDPYLRGKDLTSLVRHAQKWGVTVVIPEVVAMETVNKIRQNATEAAALVDKIDTNDLYGTAAMRDALSGHLTGWVDKYETVFTERLAELGIDVVPTPQIDHMTIARRAAECCPPYVSGRKDGYRDTLIWFTLIETARGAEGHEVWLVSHNTKDFSAGTGGDFPELAPELARELESEELADRVRFATNLRALDTHLAGIFQPLDEAGVENFEDLIDRSELIGQLLQDLLGMSPDPAAVALPASAFGATVVSAHQPKGEWTFTDESIRSDGVQTARFKIDVEVEMSVDGPGNSGDLTRMVTVSGLVATGADERTSLEITSVDATPEEMERETAKRLVRKESRRVFFEAIANGSSQGLADVADNYLKALGGPNPGAFYRALRAMQGTPDQGAIDRALQSVQAESDQSPFYRALQSVQGESDQGAIERTLRSMGGVPDQGVIERALQSVRGVPDQGAIERTLRSMGGVPDQGVIDE